MSPETSRHRFAHGCPIEWNDPEYEVHQVHIPDLKWRYLLEYDLRKNHLKRYVIRLVSAFETGMGKSILDQLYVRERWWPAMKKEGFVDGDWDWRYWTVFYDPETFHDRYEEKTGRWEILVDDEAFEKYFARDSAKRDTKSQMRSFGTGRFLWKNAIVTGPNPLWFDTMLRNFYACEWVHILDADEEGAEAMVMIRCPHFRMPGKRAFWDCLGHIRYAFSPDNKPLIDAYNIEKDMAWDAWRAKQSGVIARKPAVRKVASRVPAPAVDDDTGETVVAPPERYPLLMNRRP